MLESWLGRPAFDLGGRSLEVVADGPPIPYFLTFQMTDLAAVLRPPLALKMEMRMLGSCRTCPSLEGVTRPALACERILGLSSHVLSLSLSFTRRVLPLVSSETSVRRALVLSSR